MPKDAGMELNFLKGGFAMEWGMHGWGMGFVWVLVVLFLILGIAAFFKYLIKG